MDDLGFNKIAAAVLVTALGFMFIREVPHLLTHVETLDTPAYALEIPDVPTGGEAVEIPFPSAEFISAMNVAEGEKQFKKCTSCHNAEKGGANGTGPNLYGVVGAPAGQHAGFGYSSAMTGAGVTWNYEELNDFLTKPSKYIKGTAMNYIGLKKEEQRAAVIEYLRLKADTPMAQPTTTALLEASLPDESVSDDENVDDETVTDETVTDETMTEETVPAPTEPQE